VSAYAAAAPAVTAGGPGWTDILTAIGTVGAVMAAVGIALWTEWRSDKRIRAEHNRSDRLLREERERAAAAIEEERRLAQEREQLAQAYAVQVVEGYRAAGPLQESGGRSLTETQSGVFLVNHGSFTITDVRAWFFHQDGNPCGVSARWSLDRIFQLAGGSPERLALLHRAGDSDADGTQAMGCRDHVRKRKAPRNSSRACRRVE